jgi:hypothetical protein
MMVDNTNASVTLILTQAEALVFEALLTRLIEGKAFASWDAADQRVCWDVQADLERQIDAIFDPRYAEVLAQARRMLSRPEQG